MPYLHILQRKSSPFHEDYSKSQGNGKSLRLNAKEKIVINTVWKHNLQAKLDKENRETLLDKNLTWFA